jgi:calcium-dependent protein kinase
MGCSGTKTDKNLTENQMEKIQRTTLNIQNQVFIRQNTKPITEVYQLKESSGRGGFSLVYPAKHKSTGMKRAVKKFSKKEALTGGLDQIPKEIEILRQLSHPHILKTYEWFEDESNYYLVTEMIEGGTLLKRIEQTDKFGEREAAMVMQQLLSTINYIHSKGICHRDIKLENIMLEKSKDYSIKLIDFGFADYWDLNNSLDLTVGSPYYIAPEVINGEYNNKCDIWSTGVLMYILLSGEYPFYAQGFQNVFKKISFTAHSFKSHRWQVISPSAKDLISRMLEKDYTKRLTAKECLTHPWIVENVKSKPKEKVDDISDLKFNLVKFLSGNLLEQAFKSYLIYQCDTTQKSKNLKRLFSNMDINGDGQLSMEEIKNGLKQYFKDPVLDKYVNEVVDRMNSDNNKYIDYDEFLRVFLDTRGLINENHLKEAFDHFDIDKSGTICREELKIILKLDDNRTLEKILDEFDKNRDGLISYEEMKGVIMKSMC